jgi:hypothetical protein
VPHASDNCGAAINEKQVMAQFAWRLQPVCPSGASALKRKAHDFLVVADDHVPIGVGPSIQLIDD